MKKQCIALGTLLLVAASSLHAAPMETIRANLDRARNNIIAIKDAQFKNKLEEWNKAFSAARTFVIDNSKNLVGIKDADIVSAMNGIEMANVLLFTAVDAFEYKIDTSKITGKPVDKVALQNLINDLDSTKQSLQRNANKLDAVNVTLSNKKNAKLVATTIKTCLEHMIDHISNIFSEKIKLVK